MLNFSKSFKFQYTFNGFFLMRVIFMKSVRESNQNPKLEGSNLIDCIPQTGLCPNDCMECYYNSDGFFRTKEETLIPGLEEARGKIVRVNSGHDSNVEKDLVLSVTAKYPHRFYNTSIPDFDFDTPSATQSKDFPAPVVFTCNPKDNTWIRPDSVGNLMMVRFRVSTWNLEICDDAASFFTSRGVPFVLTFMRYRDIENVEHPHCYERQKSILNVYYQIKSQFKAEMEARYADNPLVVTCGGKTGYCRDCGNCERFYWIQSKAGRRLTKS